MNQFTGIAELDDVLQRLEHSKSRDHSDCLMQALASVAPKYISAIEKLYESSTYVKMPLIWCLIGQTNKQSMRLFSKAIKDKDQYTRWAAAEALATIKSVEASTLLVEALKDRSHLVKGTAVDAMAKFGDPGAVAQLEKIKNSKFLQKHAPGMVKSARKALRVCRGAR